MTNMHLELLDATLSNMHSHSKPELANCEKTPWIKNHTIYDLSTIYVVYAPR